MSSKAKVYCNWGLYLRHKKAPEVLIATFVFTHHALEFCRSFPPGANALVRYIGPGAPPTDEKFVTDGAHYL